MECGGNVKIFFAQSTSNSIPYEKSTSDVKNQLKTIFKVSNVKESENVFSFSLDVGKAKKAIGSNYDENWVRDGSAVLNPSDDRQTCGCQMKKPKNSKIQHKITTTEVRESIAREDDDCKPKNQSLHTRFCDLEYTLYKRCPDTLCYLLHSDLQVTDYGMIIGIVIAVVILVILIVVYVVRKNRIKLL